MVDEAAKPGRPNSAAVPAVTASPITVASTAPPAQVTCMNAHRLIGVRAEQPLSVESATSVRDAAMAIMQDRVRYLPVVEDGTLIGVVAIGHRRSGETAVGRPLRGCPTSDG
jgi:saccharopine dehydrogenase-like NADP-dependent oxidoreductase